MKIAFDLDGTLLAHPDYFVPMIQALVAAGHSVGVITGRHERLTAEGRQQWAALGLSAPDFFLDAGPGDLQGDHRQWKLDRARLAAIDLVFDDLGVFGDVHCLVVGRA